MQWLLALDLDCDPISLCRLMNKFRRKGIRVVALSLGSAGAGYSLTAVVETPETDVDHLFHFLRRSEGVEQVSCYLPASGHELDALANDAAFYYVFLNDGSHLFGNSRVAEFFPESRVILASAGKLLLEVPVDSGDRGLSAASSPLRSEEHTSELQSPMYLVCRLLLEN